MIEKYRIQVTDKIKFDREKEDAFSKFREAIAPWRALNSNCYVALGGDSGTGEWCVVFEDGFWLVFIGERGERFQVSLFTNVWDAIFFAGTKVTAECGFDKPFPFLQPTGS